MVPPTPAACTSAEGDWSMYMGVSAQRRLLADMGRTKSDFLASKLSGELLTDTPPGPPTVGSQVEHLNPVRLRFRASEGNPTHCVQTFQELPVLVDDELDGVPCGSRASDLTPLAGPENIWAIVWKSEPRDSARAWCAPKIAAPSGSGRLEASESHQSLGKSEAPLCDDPVRAMGPWCQSGSPETRIPPVAHPVARHVDRQH